MASSESRPAVTGTDLEALQRAGLEAQEDGRFPDAVAAFRQVAERRPDCAVAQHNLGLALLQTYDYRAALGALERSVALDPGPMKPRLNLARALLQQGDPQGARTQCEAAIAAHPRAFAARSLLAYVLEVSGRRDAAAEAYRAAAELAPPPGRAAPWCGLARLGCLDDPAPVERLLEQAGLQRQERAGLCFALGQTYDRRGEYERAFEHFARGNTLRLTRYDPGARADLERRTIVSHTRELLARAAGMGQATEAPVFIVGMPRSGTSLVEQILSCHGAVHPLGERSEVGLLARDLHVNVRSTTTFPEAVEALTAPVAAAMARFYLESVGGIPAGAVRITDKAPANFLFLGMLRFVFPGARVIHCVRDPRDTCLSNFFQDFGDYNVSFATDLSNLAHHYRGYRALMDHWRAVEPLPIHELSYERLVAHPEQEVRALLEFLGLAWEERCLRFHESTRAVHTASSQQVREPLHARSCGRWRHYAAHLGPLADL